jgi:hypothetical protein
MHVWSSCFFTLDPFCVVNEISRLAFIFTFNYYGVLEIGFEGTLSLVIVVYAYFLQNSSINSQMLI